LNQTKLVLKKDYLFNCYSNTKYTCWADNYQEKVGGEKNYGTISRRCVLIPEKELFKVKLQSNLETFSCACKWNFQMRFAGRKRRSI